MIVDIDVALSITNKMLWTAMMVAGPILVVTLLVGLIISVIQVATQIQEMTLTFVPKLIVVVALIFLLGHWMLGGLMSFATQVISDIPHYVK